MYPYLIWVKEEGWCKEVCYFDCCHAKLAWKWFFCLSL